ncbi:MAG: pseudouridine synthase [Bdellovibrionota bacterium]|nr:MAG: pseudouridine synthase [Bdellovibrionota bacterium]
MSSRDSSPVPAKRRKLQILYEDSAVLVLDKPACLHSVSQADSNESLAKALERYFPSLKGVGGRTGEAGLIQRLDYETSGVIIAAKDQATWRYLREELKCGQIQKCYLAVLEGTLSMPRTVRSFLGPRHRGSRKVSCWERKPKGVRALEGETVFSPLGNWKGCSVVRVSASVARRHQVRAHAALIEHPLVGDVLYGSTTALRNVFAAEEVPPFFLHAEQVAFRLPAGKWTQVQAELPHYARDVRELALRQTISSTP